MAATFDIMQKSNRAQWNSNTEAQVAATRRAERQPLLSSTDAGSAPKGPRSAFSGDFYEGPVHYSCGATERVIAIPGLDLCTSKTEARDVLLYTMAHRAVMLALKEGLLSRSQVEAGAASTRGAIARLAVFGAAEFDLDSQFASTGVASGLIAVSKQMQDLERQYSRVRAYDEFEHLRNRLAAPASHSGRTATDTLFNAICAESVGLSNWDDATWQAILAGGLNSYNNSSVGHFLAGWLHRLVSKRS